MLIQHIVQKTDGNGHQCKVQIVVITAKIPQQCDTADIEEIGERCHHQKPEQQLIVLILENQDTVCLEIKQDADDCRQKVGNNICIIKME